MEGLEDRLLLYGTTGSAWTMPARVTYSFVPDGTNIGGYSSNLYSSLTARYAASTWVAQFQLAAAVWEQAANINLVPVGDDGAPFDAGPDQQGDPNHGDIRISGVAGLLNSSTLAVTFLPPPLNGDSAAGDMVFNSTQNFTINGPGYDLETVAIHEFGHALGLGHSTITTAEMYAAYNGAKPSLTPDDVLGIDAVYGVRPPDAWIQAWHNITALAAPDISPFLNGQGQLSISNLSIDDTNYSEWFKLYVPPTATGNMVVAMQSLFLSELAPRSRSRTARSRSSAMPTPRGRRQGGCRRPRSRSCRGSSITSIRSPSAGALTARAPTRFR